MRASRYNFFVKDNKKTIWFNGLSGRVFSATPSEHGILKNVLTNPNLSTNNPYLVHWLKLNRFLVDRNTNEVEEYKSLNRQEVFSNQYELVLNPTLECNFKCWYCYQKHIQGHMSNDTIGRIKKFIEKIVIEKLFKEFSLSWFGGEPLLYFDKVMYPLAFYIKKLMNKNNIVFKHSITTNGFLINTEMIKKFDDIDLRSFQITLDGDRESHNKTRNQNGQPSYDTIVKNITVICNELTNSTVILRINYTDEIISKNYSNILSVFPENIRSQIRVCFQRVWQTNNHSNNVDLKRNTSVAGDMGFSVLDQYRVKRAHVCYADKYNYAHINFDGKVFKCTAQNYTIEEAMGELCDDGIIEWKNGIIEELYSKSNFENEHCLKCKKLPICGGPCMRKARDFREGKTKNVCIDTCREIKVDSFVREYYKSAKKKCKKERIGAWLNSVEFDKTIKT